MRIGADKIRKILLANDYVGFASITGPGPIIDQYAYSTLLTFCTAYSIFGGHYPVFPSTESCQGSNSMYVCCVIKATRSVPSGWLGL